MSLKLENRTFSEVQMVFAPKLSPVWTPTNTQEECACEPYLVCGSNSANSWEKDTTGAWIKLFSASDTATFNLYKDGVLAGIQPSIVDFVNDAHSVYCINDWTEVLNSDGVGCYSIEIDFTIGGVSDTIKWGEYQLFEFNSLVVDRTVRIKTIFDSNQSIEGIDFSGSKVLDTYRFRGWFGDRQPRMEIDNIIYADRSVKKVTRENINEYTLFTNEMNEVDIRRLTDLYLLSENEIYLSDFNALNPTYNYLDIPVVVSESPEIEYFQASRKSTLSVKFNDKIKNTRSYY
jgi:hypothetical protein